MRTCESKRYRSVNVNVSCSQHPSHPYAPVSGGLPPPIVFVFVDSLYSSYVTLLFIRVQYIVSCIVYSSGLVVYYV